jgi:hypothetical protein
VGLERSPLSLVSTIEELLERKSSGSGLENREYGRRDPSRWPRGTLYPQNLALTSSKKRRSLGRYSSLADSDHGVFFVIRIVFVFRGVTPKCINVLIHRNALIHLFVSWSAAHCWGLWHFSISWSYSQSVGLLGVGISPSTYTQGNINRLNAHTDIHASSGIWTNDPSVWLYTARPLWSAYTENDFSQKARSIYVGAFLAAKRDGALPELAPHCNYIWSLIAMKLEPLHVSIWPKCDD